MGKGIYNRTDVPGKVERERNPGAKTAARPESEWLTVAWPPIVGEPLWNRVQIRLRKNKAEKAGRPGDSTNWIRGFVVCDACEHRLRAKP